MKKFILTLAISSLFTTTWSQVATWTNGGGNNLFSNPLNWSTGVIPGATNDVLFNGTTSAQCDIDLNATVQSVTGNASYIGALNMLTGFDVVTSLDFTWNSSAIITGNTGSINIGRNFFMSAGSYIAGSGAVNVTGAYSQNGTTNTVDLSAAGLVTYSSTFTLQNGIYNAPLSQVNKSNFTVSGGTFTNNGGTIRFTGVGSTTVATSNSTAPIINNTQPFYNLIFDNTVIAPTNYFKNYKISGTITINNDLTYDYGATLGTQRIITNKDAATAGVIVVKNSLTVITGATTRNYDGGSATIELNKATSPQIINVNNLNNGYTLCHVKISGPSRTIQNQSGTFQQFNLNCMDFTVAASGPITLKTSLYLKGNFNNDGNLIIPDNQITYFRADANNQMITTPSELSFFSLRCQNSTTYSVSQLGDVAVRDNMVFGVNSTFNINGKRLTFKSLPLTATTTKTGMINDLTAVTTANLIGNFIMERYLKGGKTGWVLLGSPFGAQNTLADWIDNFAMSGFTGATGNTFPAFTSMYTYDETQPGPVGSDPKYIAATNVTNSIGTGKGWWAYVGTSLNTTTDITIDVVGSLTNGVNRNDVNIPVTVTANNGALPNIEDGWNLIANPYPGALDFNKFYSANATCGPSIFVYNADLAADATYSATTGISAPSQSSGGVGKMLPSSRAFNVQVSATGNLVAKENQKSVSSDNFTMWRTNGISPDSATQYFRISMLNVADGRTNDCVINFNDAATTGIDIYDAVKGITKVTDKATMTLMTKLNGVDYTINSIPLDSVNVTTIALSTHVGTSGTYTLGATNLATILPSKSCVTLIDHKLNTTTNLRTGNYTTTLDSSENAIYRFDVVIVPNTGLEITAVVNVPQPNDSLGTVQVTPTIASNYNYYLINTATGIKVDSVINAPSANFTGIKLGMYKVQASQVGGNICSVAETAFEMVGNITAIKTTTDKAKAITSYYANGTIVLKTTTTYEPAIINVYNALGQLLSTKKIALNGQTEFVNLSNIAPQTLVMSVISNSINYTNKIIVN
ncbi:MAG: hypothetical protein H7331_08580 [Bacteroidia bacterium]|nr:hypothetical protein [Bacteroidia bacterium]